MSFSEKKFRSLNSQGFHTLVYNDWGPEDAAPIICVHGLTGNGHDFDFLAEDLIEKGYRLIAVDLPGRGRSDFLQNSLDYSHKQYCHDLVALLNHLGYTAPGSVDWLGVSLGGLLGIRLAGINQSPIRRLILNDVGPVVPKAALDFIHHVIKQTYIFDTVAEMEQRMRDTRGLTWGPMTDAQWKHMAEHNVRALEDGSLTYGYDPRIGDVFAYEPIGEIDLWEYWDRIACPVLLIQGGKSMILPAALVAEMQSRGPGKAAMDLAIFEDCGHVPSLWAPNQIQAIAQWLSTAPTS
jgi:pimeloyl-ACP methyl ester carboxylesterase